MSSGALDQSQLLTLKEIQAALGQTSRLLVKGAARTDDGLLVALDLETSEFSKAEGGLPVEPVERLWMLVPPSWPHLPPRVEVDHQRWDLYPHVLQGRRLCLYLDPAGEWNPTAGWQGFFERLWGWFDDAIAGRFDPTTALYHPVGGVLHRTEGTPTVVVTQSLDEMGSGFSTKGIALRRRAKNRVDVVAWDRTDRAPGTIPGMLIVLSGSLPRGGGNHLSDLAIAIRGQDARHQRRKFLSDVLKMGRALQPDQHLYVVIAVPNPHLDGERGLHLVGWRLPQPSVESAVRAAQTRHKAEDSPSQDEPELEWTYVDDCRSAVTTRRDSPRPVNWFAGKAIEIWGCGALGSWLGENAARAGVRSIVLRDNGYVSRGLLVRQNYTEEDVGDAKVEALARRLQAISDLLTVRPVHGPAQLAVSKLAAADVVFDCTVNTSMAVAVRHGQTSGLITVPVAQVATDYDTATLGVLTITSGKKGETSDQIDLALRRAAESTEALKPFRRFWDRDHHGPITPTLGCSVPTFAGSSADAQSVAATAVTLTALALNRQIAAGYLFATPHTPHDVPAITQAPLS